MNLLYSIHQFLFYTYLYLSDYKLLKTKIIIYSLCSMVEIGWLGQANGDLNQSMGEHVARVDDKLDLK